MLKSEAPFPIFATRALGSIGPRALCAVTALAKRLDGNPNEAADAGVALLRIDVSQRKLVESRLRSIPVGKQLYLRAVLAGLLGRRTPEADGFVRRDLRAIESNLCRLAALVADEVDLSFQDVLLRSIASGMDGLSSLGIGAEGAAGRLTELTHHSDPEVRRLAAEALKRIRAR
jgi:hypothetical protein